jgi:hypothetical protein
MDWLEWLSRQVYKQNSGLKLSKTDPLVLLRAIAHEGKAFALFRAERSYVQELWDCRNRWAHNTEFDEADTSGVGKSSLLRAGALPRLRGQPALIEAAGVRRRCTPPYGGEIARRRRWPGRRTAR